MVLRLEDLDRTRSSPALLTGLVADLAWFGLDWDESFTQSALGSQHEAALDRLAASGLLYPCRCSRSQRRAGSRLAPDGGHAYDNRCRERSLPAGGWRATTEPIRCRLPDRQVVLFDEGGTELSQHPAIEMGDPIVVRRDRVLAYHLVVVVDDAAAGVTRIVRGRDLATATATQVLLQEHLEIATPTYRHHLLFLEPSRGKLAKLHGSVGVSALRARYDARALCGVIASACGLRPGADPVTPGELLQEFDWARVSRADVIMSWDGSRLEVAENAAGPS